MRWRTFLVLVLLMILSTGGSFTCIYHSGDDNPPISTTRP